MSDQEAQFILVLLVIYGLAWLWPSLPGMRYVSRHWWVGWVAVLCVAGMHFLIPFGVAALYLVIFLYLVRRETARSLSFAAWLDENRAALLSGATLEYAGTPVHRDSVVAFYSYVLCGFCPLPVAERFVSRSYIVGAGSRLWPRLGYTAVSLLLGWWSLVGIPAVIASSYRNLMGGARQTVSGLLDGREAAPAPVAQAAPAHAAGAHPEPTDGRQAPQPPASGTDQPVRYCWKCGCQRPPEAAFCPQCGTPFGASAVQATPGNRPPDFQGRGQV